MDRRGGFTLLELLVAIFLAALASSMVVMSIRSPNSENALHDECSKYGRLFAFLSEQSMVENILIGLYVDQKGFSILQKSQEQSSTKSGNSLASQLIAMYDDYEKRDWVPLELPEIKSKYTFGEEVKIELRVGGLSYQGEDKGKSQEQLTEKTLKTKTKDKIQPQIFFYPSMEVTPFEMRFKSATFKNVYILKIQENGSVILKTGDNDDDPETF